jgi:hypothetical protein
VRLSQVLRPKEPGNLRAAAATSALLVAVFVAGAAAWPWSPKRGLGLAFGFLATALFVFEMAYPFRRPKARPLGTAKSWAQAHVYLGTLALLAVLIHAGFRLPRGGLGWALLLLSLWTTASGLMGVWLQKWIPAALAEGLRVEALYERIPGLVDQLVAEADVLMAGADEVGERFYRTEVRPSLSRPSPSWGFLLDVRASRDRALEPFRRVAQFVDAAQKPLIDDLMSIYTEKIELDAHYSLQGILRRWLVLHVPTAGLLMGLLAVHVFAWAWY